MMSKSGKMWMALAGLAIAGCDGDMGGDGFFPDGMMSPVDDRVVVRSQVAPPPISGGTLIVSRDQRTAIAADPDHDVVWRVDVGGVLSGPNAGPILSATALEPGDQPGRLVEDVRGWIHVVLRGGGAIATIDPANAQRVTRTAVCPEPRGLAYDDAADVLHVACTNGELVTLVAATPGDEVRRVQLDDDLRDVVVRHGASGNSLFVSRFRSAEVLELAGDGTLTFRHRLPTTQQMIFTMNDEGTADFAPGAAWRMVALQDGTVQVVHQRGQTGDITISTEQPGGYGGGFDGCTPGIVQSASSRIDPEDGSVQTSSAYARVVLPVDVAVSSDGEMAVASAGTRSVAIEPAPQGDHGFDDGCSPGVSPIEEYPMVHYEQFTDETAGRQPVAVAYRQTEGGSDQLLVQVRDPAAIIDMGTDRVFLLPASAVSDSGHQTFHEAASVSAESLDELGFEGGFAGLGAELACASCHMEGREDGRIWNFTEIGPRRTQNVAGGILGTEPFHWDGDMTHFETLMDDVFVGRMAGAQPSSDRMAAVSLWLDTVPAARVGLVVDDASVERGRALFEDQDVGCAGCHTGAKLTNNRTVDVGTGGEFQVPSLVGVSARAPYLHDGRAATLRDRFGYGGGGDRHGLTSQLSANEINDLVAYLETL